MLSENWMRSSSWVVGRKLRLPVLPNEVEMFGAIEFASRGRTSRAYWPRNSFTIDGERIHVHCPITVWVRFFSVPSFETARFVIGVVAPPVFVAFSALLSLKL